MAVETKTLKALHFQEVRAFESQVLSTQGQPDVNLHRLTAEEVDDDSARTAAAAAAAAQSPRVARSKRGNDSALLAPSVALSAIPKAVAHASCTREGSSVHRRGLPRSARGPSHRLTASPARPFTPSAIASRRLVRGGRLAGPRPSLGPPASGLGGASDNSSSSFTNCSGSSSETRIKLKALSSFSQSKFETECF